MLEPLRAPFFAGELVESWAAPSGRMAVATLAHAPERLGGVRYRAARGDTLALFCGRPIAWEGERADGRGPLDPSRYLEEPEAWAAALDGRFAVLRCDDAAGELAVVGDALGAYPLYAGNDAAGATWVSNTAEAVRAACGAAELSPAALAGVLGGGWSLDGHPLYAGVRRLAWGVVHRLGPTGRDRSALLTDAQVARMCGAGFDAGRAARLLVAGTGALADWPGRPNIVPVTGGRDSRLVLAAAVRAGVDFAAQTGGLPDSPDVVIGRRVAEAAGLPHGMTAPHPRGDLLSDWPELAWLLARGSGGTATLADGGGFPFGPVADPGGPLPLWHTGQGGEIARGYYGGGSGDPADRLLRAFLGRRPGRKELLSAQGTESVRGQIERWAGDQRAAGARDEDLPDLFYLTRRMATWAAPTHGAVEPIRDSTSPLWSVRLLGDLLGLPAAARGREEFHLRVLERLAPELVDLPFEGGRPWPGRQSALTRRARRAAGLAGKVRRELARRRATAPAPPAPAEVAGVQASSPAPADPFDRVVAEVRAVVLAQPDHPAWPLLDRPRVEELLSRPAAALDAMSRAYVWRLATVFGTAWPPPPQPPS